MAAPKGLIQKDILRHATRLFAASGVDATSLQQIADEVGIRKASLLYHFSSKAELRRAVLESLLARWRGVVPRVLLAAPEGMQQFDAIIDELIGFFAREPDRARLLLRELLDRPDQGRELLSSHVRPWIEMAVRHIEAGQSKGRVRPEVDAEAYVFHAIQLVLSSIATQSVLASYGQERQLEELKRIARASLFVLDEEGEG